MLIAFSSVAHMALMLLVLSSSNSFSHNCALLILLRHGIRSSIAFFFSFLFYKIAHTRRIILNKGASVSLGLPLLFWTFCCLGVIGAPPTFNLWVEVNSFISVVSLRPHLIKVLFWGAFLTGAYSLTLLSAPMSFNFKTRFSTKDSTAGIDLVHLAHSTVLLILLAFLIPMIIMYIYMNKLENRGRSVRGSFLSTRKTI